MSRRAKEPAGELPRLGGLGCVVAAGAGPLPAEGTQSGSTVVPPLAVGTVPPDERVPEPVGLVEPVEPVDAVPPEGAVAPPVAASADAGSSASTAIRTRRQRRMIVPIGRSPGSVESRMTAFRRASPPARAAL